MAHKFVAAPRKGDTNGTDTMRLLEDLRRCRDCPLETFLTDAEKRDKLKQCFRDVENRMAEKTDLCTLPTYKHYETHLLQPTNAKKLAQLRNRPLQSVSNAGDAESETLLSEKMSNKMDNLDANQKDELKNILALVDVLDMLYENPLLRNGVAYKHIIDLSQSTDLKDRKTPRLRQCWYIVRPMFLFFFSFAFQSLMLHITTHFYIVYMIQEEGDNERIENGGQLLDLVGNFVARWLGTGAEGQGAVLEGSVAIPLKLLDASGGVPLLLCGGCYVLAFFYEGFNIGLWNKSFMVASILAIMKGIFDVITILPDSIGWESCKDRLGEAGLRTMRENHFIHNFWPTLFKAIWQEVLPPDGKRIRYCADMMISGHTYFAALFSLSAYKLVDSFPTGWRWKYWIRILVGLLCIISMVAELGLVAAARFHYTVDMLAAIVLVVLLFDSAHLEQVAANWSEGFYWGGTTDDELQQGKGVLPSQSSLVNYRVVAGHSPWTGTDDLLVQQHAGHHADQHAAGN